MSSVGARPLLITESRLGRTGLPPDRTIADAPQSLTGRRYPLMPPGSGATRPASNVLRPCARRTGTTYTWGECVTQTCDPTIYGPSRPRRGVRPYPHRAKLGWA